MDAAGLFANEARLEEHFRAAETLAANRNDVAIRKLIGFLLIAALACLLHLSVKVQGDVGELLLDVAHNLALCCGSEGIAALRKDLHQVFREIAACKVKAQNGMRQ